MRSVLSLLRERRVVAGRKSLFPVTVACALIVLGWLGAPSRPQAAEASSITGALSRHVDPKARMLVEADELRYDHDNDRISAVGHVQIYYSGYTLEAEKVTLDRKTSRMYAEGNVRMTAPDGNTIVAQTLNLTDDFRDGFVRSLRVETPERTRFTARKAERVDGDTTVFHDGIYTACGSCEPNPSKPPTWRIKAKKIIHKQKERMIYYEQATLEFWGKPVAYLPFLSHPDPSVKRRSGFLSPRTLIADNIGVGVSVPYFWAPKQNYDLTFITTPLSRQGLLAQAEWRHRLSNGMYSVRVTGIRQLDPKAFAGTSGNRQFRGMVESKGRFKLSKNWKWGWDVTATTDRSFTKDYRTDTEDPDEAVSTLFLTGMSRRNYFDARLYSFRVFQEDGTSAYQKRLQEKQPVVYPSIDYNYIFARSIYGGELSANFGLYSMSRNDTDLRSAGLPTTRYFGIDGNHGRAHLDMMWRRTFIGPLGQNFTPFIAMRGDMFFLSDTDPTITGLTKDDLALRTMPAVGVEYRYPFISTHKWGSQIIEPIAQLIVRPNETRIGTLPNEDAQSLVFDDTSLFDLDKFSGYDRAEGGTRVNLGLQYRLMFRGGGYASALFGQSYQISGVNSFSQPGLVRTGADTGLESEDSDYVARLYFDSNKGWRFGAQVSFDENDLAIKRAVLNTTGLMGPFVGSLTYSYLGRQPSLGITSDRSEFLSAASIKIRNKWRVFGALRYDVYNSNVVRDAVGLAYDDESLSASIAFSEDRSRANGDPIDRTVFVRFGLRTIGDGQLSTNVDK